MSVEFIIYRRSYDSMNRSINKLRINLKRVPEERQRLRESLLYRLEMLYIIRQDMKKLMRLA